jgi:hypothetical protein
MRSVVIAVAITGSVPRKRDNPAVPIAVSEQIESTHEAFEAGASLVHIHVRNADESASSSPELFARVQEGIRRLCPGMIIQFSTGGRDRDPSARGSGLRLKPDMASLSTGSVNFPTIVYENSAALIRELAGSMREFRVRPEIEIFDLSHIHGARRLVDEGLIDERPHVQFVLGIKNAMPAEPHLLDILLGELSAYFLMRLGPPPGSDATRTRSSTGSWRAAESLYAPALRTIFALPEIGLRAAMPSWSGLQPRSARATERGLLPRRRREPRSPCRASGGGAECTRFHTAAHQRNHVRRSWRHELKRNFEKQGKPS